MATDHSGPGGPHLALVGLMGAGKSEVGAAVAQRRSLRHLDLDVLVTGREGRSVGVLFEEQGESGFRDCEQAALADVLSLVQPVVLSTGGGVLERLPNRELLSERATVVWLRARPETLAERVGDGVDRPLLQAGNPAEVLAELSTRRGSDYEAAADHVVDTDDMTVDEVADTVVAALPDPVTT